MTWTLLLVIGCGCAAGSPSFSSFLVSSTAASWTSGPGGGWPSIKIPSVTLLLMFQAVYIVCVCICVSLEAWQWCLRLWRVTDTLLRSTGGTTSSASSSESLTTWNFQSSRLRWSKGEICHWLVVFKGVLEPHFYLLHLWGIFDYQNTHLLWLSIEVQNVGASINVYAKK